MTPIATTHPELFSTSCTTSCPRVCSKYLEPNGRRFCRHDLASTLATGSVEDVLERLVRLRVIRSWKVIGEVVFIDGERPPTKKTPPPAWRATAYGSPKERLFAAMEVVVDADPSDGEVTRRAWERLRRAVWVWIAATAGGRGKLRAMVRTPHWDERVK